MWSTLMRLHFSETHICNKRENEENLVLEPIISQKIFVDWEKQYKLALLIKMAWWLSNDWKDISWTEIYMLFGFKKCFCIFTEKNTLFYKKTIFYQDRESSHSCALVRDLCQRWKVYIINANVKNYELNTAEQF